MIVELFFHGLLTRIKEVNVLVYCTYGIAYSEEIGCGYEVMNRSEKEKP
jgi:hypothetical protein